MPMKLFDSPTKRNRPNLQRRRRWLLSLLIVAAAGLGLIPVLQAVHDDGLFELDRNVTDDVAVPGEDWDRVFAGTDTASASVFIHDPDNSTIFTQGGSKDDLDTTNWHHTNGSVPDKDELADGFAARYGDNLYFGADRIANNGDSQMGFWFFQQEVTPQAGGVFGPGKHEDGDILVLSDFTKGGGLPTVRVFQWNGPGGTIPGQGAIDGTLDLVAGTTAQPQDCVGPPGVPAGDNFCATVNAAAFTPPWSFTPKSGSGIQPGEFYEGGIDLGFLHLENECFASFLVETRSSQSVDAVLKDFVGGSFQPCTSKTETHPSDANGNLVTEIFLGESIYDFVRVTGEGSNAVPTGTVDFFICNPTQVTNNGGNCSTGGSTVSSDIPLSPANPPTTPSSATALSGQFTPNAIGTWCWRAEYSGDDNYPPSSDGTSTECFLVKQLQPHIATAQTWTVQDSATITVDTSGGDLAGSVTFELFVNDTTCAGSAALTTGPIAVAGPSGQTVNSGVFTITVPGGPNTFSWKVTYDSTKDAHKDAVSTCHNENGTLTFTNGVTQP